MIKLTFSTIDGLNERKQFKLLAGARKYAQAKLGRYVDISGLGYAVGADGVSKIHRVSGCTLEDLFAEDSKEPE